MDFMDLHVRVLECGEEVKNMRKKSMKRIVENKVSAARPVSHTEVLNLLFLFRFDCPSVFQQPEPEGVSCATS